LRPRQFAIIFRREGIIVSRLAALGWRAKIALRDGVEKTYASFLAEQAAGTLRG
jgi:nucleoside-diphosphate-sugar epimerase